LSCADRLAEMCFFELPCPFAMPLHDVAAATAGAYFCY
jgi:hypothetical protein